MISKMSYKKETSNHPNTAQWSQLQPIPTASQLDKAEDVTFLSFLFRRWKGAPCKKKFKDTFQAHLSLTWYSLSSGYRAQGLGTPP